MKRSVFMTLKLSLLVDKKLKKFYFEKRGVHAINFINNDTQQVFLAIIGLLLVLKQKKSKCLRFLGANPSYLQGKHFCSHNATMSSFNVTGDSKEKVKMSKPEGWIVAVGPVIIQGRIKAP